MNPAEELKELLRRVNRTRRWLADETGYAFGSVRQYLGGSKQSRPFFKKAREVLLAEEAFQKAGRPAVPQWNLIFDTEEQFLRVDRASRLADAPGIKEFCRDATLARADEILERKKRGVYPKLAPLKGAKVAEKDPD